jgi:hypothetical protein
MNSTLARKTRTFLLAAAMLAAIAWVDYVTGYEVSVFLLYLIPIWWVTRSVNLPSGLLFCLLSAVVLRWADYKSGRHFSRDWIYLERGVTVFINFTVIALYVHTFNKKLAHAKIKVRQLEGILPICMVCHRIMGKDGTWGDLNTYLQEHTAAEVEKRVCPHCSGAKALTDYSL